MSEFHVPDLPALRIFDAKATRGAVIRGLVRTGFVVMAFLLVAGLVIGTGVHLASNALGRPEQLNRMSVAFQVAHPGFRVNGESSKTGGWRQTATLTGRSNGGPSQDVRLSLNIFGTLDPNRLRDDPLDELLGGASWPKKSTEIFLRRLPVGVTVDGVVVFSRPVPTPVPVLEETDWQGAEVLFYSPPFASSFGRTEVLRDTFQNPVSWGMINASPFASFSDWTAKLGSRDDDNLRGLGLPSSRELKDLALDGRVTGFYVRGLTPAVASRLLADSRIASFTPSAVQYDLSMPQ